MTIDNILQLVSIISCFAAVGGLIFVGIQFKQNIETNREIAFLNSIDRYFDLRKMIIVDEDLAETNNEKEQLEMPKTKHKYYICLLIQFFEALYLTKRINIFPKIKGGTWDNFIKHTISKPMIRQVWKDETEDKSKSDFADDFIDYINKLI